MIKKTDKIAYRQKSIEQLKAELLLIRKKLAQDCFKLSMGQIKDTSVIKKSKYMISFISTLINESKPKRSPPLEEESTKNNDNK
ncbi:50S ribosomal protein L29 [Patescibacteria group bacterium]|nr:50S ribosomal protein L29 [Patescibacteria group bacterium]MCG2702445.1 50S ribosomal protein L29 [Candidatus Parcubacteria bacterium]MBU4264505.1 50S ribosomal protein L29 [Patescibacteria group bacterium]MBU4390436.1 50S ribosomal protein L29 [Patescibacteria group bacterium]MBU4396707.1 50S ribosomal protein L29 [Patescibacteria group bacterium]